MSHHSFNGPAERSSRLGQAGPPLEDVPVRSTKPYAAIALALAMTTSVLFKLTSYNAPFTGTQRAVTAAMQASVAASAVLIFLSRLRRRSTLPMTDTQRAIIRPIAVFATISLLWTNNRIQTASTATLWWTLVAYKLPRQGEAALNRVWFILTTLVFASIPLSLTSYGRLYSGLWTGAFSNPNETAIIGVLASALLLESNGPKWGAFAATATLIMCIGGGSRNGMIASSILLVLCFGSARAYRYDNSILLVYAFVTSILSWFVVAGHAPRFVSAFASTLLRDRLGTWTDGWNAFLHSPLLGVGGGASRLEVSDSRLYLADTLGLFGFALSIYATIRLAVANRRTQLPIFCLVAIGLSFVEAWMFAIGNVASYVFWLSLISYESGWVPRISWKHPTRPEFLTAP